MTRPASLLFINQHYHPDIAATGQKLTDLAEYLAARGYDVSVLCSQGRYLTGALQAPRRETLRGVRIRRTGGIGLGRGSHLKRLIDYAVFYLAVLTRLLFGRRHDLVVVLTTPPLLGVAAALARRLRGQRYAIWSMDLHPDAEIALGMLRADGPAARLLHALNNVGYRNAEFVAVLGPYMKDRIARQGIDRRRLFTLPMWDDAARIYPLAPYVNPVRKALGLDGKFVVMYSGNAGLAHRFEELLDAMRTLRDHPDLFFLFAGHGPQRPAIEAFAAAHGIDNFRYIDYVDRDLLVESLGVGDVHLLTLRHDMAGIAVPCKLYGIMAAGRPVVMVGPERSEPGETILETRAGYVIDPAHEGADSADRLADTLRALAAAPDACAAIGDRARAAFLAGYHMDVVCDAWMHVIAHRRLPAALAYRLAQRHLTHTHTVPADDPAPTPV